MKQGLPDKFYKNCLKGIQEIKDGKTAPFDFDIFRGDFIHTFKIEGEQYIVELPSGYEAMTHRLTIKGDKFFLRATNGQRERMFRARRTRYMK